MWNRSEIPHFQSPRFQISTQKSVSKVPWKQTRKQHQVSGLRCLKSLKNNVRKSSPNYKKSDPGSPRVLPAAPEVAQGAPKVPNGPPGCQNEGTRPPNAQFWAPQPTNIFSVSEASSSLRTNVQKPASQQTFQQRNSIKQKPSNRNTIAQ